MKVPPDRAASTRAVESINDPRRAGNESFQGRAVLAGHSTPHATKRGEESTLCSFEQSY
jgi:hypothetical protein